VGKARAYQSHTRLHSNKRLLAFPTNIRLGWLSVEIANTLDYYDAETITPIIVAIFL